MKAQEYADKYLPLIKEVVDDEKALKELSFKAFVEFCDEVQAIAKSRRAIVDKAVISIIKEVAQKWNKFCRIINESQTDVKFNEGLFLKYWKEKVGF